MRENETDRGKKKERELSRLKGGVRQHEEDDRKKRQNEIEEQATEKTELQLKLTVLCATMCVRTRESVCV